MNFTFITQLLWILGVVFISALADVHLDPLNNPVLLGSNAQFNCSVTENWLIMAWLLNGEVVLTISIKHGVFENVDRFSAANYTTDESYKWALTIKNTSRTDSGEVTCDVQNVQRLTATLSIQEVGTVDIAGGNVTVRQGEEATFVCSATGWFPEPDFHWRVNGAAEDSKNINTTVEAVGDVFNSTSVLKIPAVHSGPVECLVKVPALYTPQISVAYLTVDASSQRRDQTVLIAVTVSFSLAALLALLIILIIFCCRRRKEKKTSYEEEIRRAREMSDKSPVPGKGNDNPGFITDATSPFSSVVLKANTKRSSEQSRNNVSSFNKKLHNNVLHASGSLTLLRMHKDDVRHGSSTNRRPGKHLVQTVSPSPASRPVLTSWLKFSLMDCKHQRSSGMCHVTTVFQDWLQNH
ncbi:immunoglobulin superfamily member 5-like [Denticeps clupeoides]|uniref:immunoglobulin superfamily member 5-like n=1 Tax=Denticeps clupeoides TaxID=299321 RepID=UPI0010A2CD29|nr:immunoglobulin superfamily member 5-like [Denticeps clupeoides]